MDLDKLQIGDMVAWGQGPVNSGKILVIDNRWVIAQTIHGTRQKIMVEDLKAPF